MDPEHGEGAKIPDLTAFPSGTLQMMKEGVLTTGTGGDTVAIAVGPVIGDNTSIYPITITNGTSGGVINSASFVNWSARAAATAAYNVFRPVSASVEVYFIGNSTTDGGRICGGGFLAQGVNPAAYSLLEDRPETDEWAMRNGMRVLWKPLDESNFIYADVKGIAAGNLAGNSYYIAYPQIMIAATGLPSASTVLGYKVVVNFEAIPSLAYYDLVESTPSPFNQSMLRQAFEWAAESGNNIAAIVGNAYPYVQTGMNLLQAGTRIANSLGYTPLPQRERFRGRSIGIRGPLAVMTQSTDVASNDKDNDGKEEEDFAEAERKFNEMLISDKKPSIEPALKNGTPKGSPISLRKVQ